MGLDNGVWPNGKNDNTKASLPKKGKRIPSGFGNKSCQGKFKSAEREVKGVSCITEQG